MLGHVTPIPRPSRPGPAPRSGPIRPGSTRTTDRALAGGPAASAQAIGIDEVDRVILAGLSGNGRAPVAGLAKAAGVAESTCAARLRALQTRGVIRGIHADIDPASVGLLVEAMVAVRFGGHVREHVEAFRDQVSRAPGVLEIYNTSGANDYLVHVTATGAEQLRDFVLDHVANRPGVVHAETSLIFESTRGSGPTLAPVGGVMR